MVWRKKRGMSRKEKKIEINIIFQEKIVYLNKKFKKNNKKKEYNFRTNIEQIRKKNTGSRHMKYKLKKIKNKKQYF